MLADICPTGIVTHIYNSKHIFIALLVRATAQEQSIWPTVKKLRHKNSVELTIRKNKESLSVATVFREKVL